MATILIIEDDEEMQRMLQFALKRAGHEVYGSPNGVDALYQVSYYKPDLVILDLMMPLASGDAVLQHIRNTRELRDTRVLVLSAHPHGARIAEEFAADAFVAKPVELHTLTERIEQMLAGEQGSDTR